MFPSLYLDHILNIATRVLLLKLVISCCFSVEFLLLDSYFTHSKSHSLHGGLYDILWYTTCYNLLMVWASFPSSLYSSNLFSLIFFLCARRHSYSFCLDCSTVVAHMPCPLVFIFIICHLLKDFYPDYLIQNCNLPPIPTYIQFNLLSQW